MGQNKAKMTDEIRGLMQFLTVILLLPDLAHISLLNLVTLAAFSPVVL